MKAYLKQVRISPKKANLIAALVRNKKAQEAIDMLKFTPKKAAPILKKLIESAVANAKNNFKQNEETLVIKEIIVTEGPTYKRSVPISRGRSHPILKRTSHITVTLTQNVSEPQKEAPKKEQPKKEEKEEKTPEVKDEKPETKAKKTTDKDSK